MCLKYEFEVIKAAQESFCISSFKMYDTCKHYQKIIAWIEDPPQPVNFQVSRVFKLRCEFL